MLFGVPLTKGLNLDGISSPEARYRRDGDNNVVREDPRCSDAGTAQQAGQRNNSGLSRGPRPTVATRPCRALTATQRFHSLRHHSTAFSRWSRAGGTTFGARWTAPSPPELRFDLTER